MGAQKLIEKGEFMYDEIYHIPPVIAHPESQAPGTTCNEFVYLQEIMLSALDAASLSVPSALDGEAFLSAIEGKPYSNSREKVYCVFNRHFTIANQRMVRTRTHQFTFNSGDPGELYDLANDPYQFDNRYGDPAYEEVRRDLIGRMNSYMSELNDPLRVWFARIKGAY